MNEDYRDLIARLARQQAALAAEQEEIRAWYAGEVAAAQAAVDRAGAAVADADAELATAMSTVERTDLEAHRLWRLLEDRAGTLGSPPGPAPRADHGDEPALRLQAAEDRLERARRAPRPELPSWASPLLVLFGVAGAAAGYAAAAGARWAALRGGGDFGVFAPVLAQIMTLLGPVLGLLPARVLADRGGARLDAGAVAVVVLTGLLALGVLVFLVGR